MQDIFQPSQAPQENRAYSSSMSRPSHRPRSEVGKRLAELRQAKGLTQKQLAETLGTAFQNIAYWERSASAPPGNVLPKMSSIFGVSVDELLGVRQMRPVQPRGRLHKVVNALSQLPRRQQQKVLEVIEAFVNQHGNGHKQAA